MDLNAAINTALLVACVCAIAYAAYVKIKSNAYTREQYTFAALSSIVTLAILGVDSVSTKPSWSVLHSLWSTYAGSGATVSQAPHWSEQVLLVVLLIFAMYFIHQSVHSWNGQISVEQQRRKDLHDDRPWMLDGIEDLRRLVLRGPPITVYRRLDYTRSFSPIESSRDILAWHQNAKDLVQLR